MTRAAIYARVSTSKQDTANQVRELEEFAARRGWEITHRFVETEPGWEPDREQLTQLYVRAYRREFDLVLVWALDRFSRQGVASTLSMIQRLAAYGVPLVSFREEFLSTVDPRMAELVTPIFAWVARQEHLRISERTKAGMARRRAQGASFGRPKRFQITASALARARLHRARGESWKKVLAAAELPPGALSTLRRLLVKGGRNPLEEPEGRSAPLANGPF